MLECLERLHEPVRKAPARLNFSGDAIAAMFLFIFGAGGKEFVRRLLQFAPCGYFGGPPFRHKASRLRCRATLSSFSQNSAQLASME